MPAICRKAAWLLALRVAAKAALVRPKKYLYPHIATYDWTLYAPDAAMAADQKKPGYTVRGKANTPLTFRFLPARDQGNGDLRAADHPAS